MAPFLMCEQERHSLAIRLVCDSCKYGWCSGCYQKCPVCVPVVESAPKEQPNTGSPPPWPTNDRPLVERPWEEFQAAGLLWWVNRILHLFGWAIVVVMDDDGKVERTYPARTTFRGFDPSLEVQGFQRLTGHLAESIAQLSRETLR